METYLPSPLNFFGWDKVKQGFSKGKVLNPPLCIELNITGKRGKGNFYVGDIDIFTLQRILEEIKTLNTQWLVMGYKNDIFLYKSINSFFKILKNLNLKIFSLQTDCLYLNRVDLDFLFSTTKGNIFVKKKGDMKNYEREIFRENLLKLMDEKRKKKYENPEIFLLKDEYEVEEKYEFEKRGAKFLNEILFCREEILPFLPFFFLSIDSNGFCFSGENDLEPLSSIFFNSIKKIWFSKKIRVLRKNILGGFKEEVLIKIY